MPILYQVLPLNYYSYLQCDTEGGTYVYSTASLKILVIYTDTY